ncbi:protein of unknown function [Candidatus Promineifilum breve]|uniref:Uncharacterized protein n=1 Tax=Candidatus Promineifilum breve TaxID=1806508 RepID=A0A160T1P2_9CHLR|nr:protein of unknown function [Candidatus Promineifilum breve]
MQNPVQHRPAVAGVAGRVERQHGQRQPDRREAERRKFAAEGQPHRPRRGCPGRPRPLIRPLPEPPEQKCGQKGEERRAHVGRRVTAVGQQVRLEEQQDERRQRRRPAPQLPGQAVADQTQHQREQDDGQAGQEDDPRGLVVVLPHEQVGELIPPLTALPTGVIGRQAQGGHGQQRQGAKAVDQRRMLQAQPRIARAQKGQATGNVVLLVHRRAIVNQTLDRQKEKEQQRGHRRPQAPMRVCPNRPIPDGSIKPHTIDYNPSCGGRIRRAPYNVCAPSRRIDYNRPRYVPGSDFARSPAPRQPDTPPVDVAIESRRHGAGSRPGVA